MMQYLAQAAFLAASLALVVPSRGIPAQGQPQCAAEAPRREAATVALRRLLDSLSQANANVPGIALSVRAPTACFAWTGTAGVADRTTQRTLALDHAHRIASITKTFVAVAVLRLVEDGRLRLDDALTKLVSEQSLAPLRRDGYAVDQITVKHLLTHTAGLFDYAMTDQYAATIEREPAHRWTRQEQIERAVDWGAPYGAPGSIFHYSDTGYILLGEILERITKKPYARAVRDLVNYGKLGLRSTYMESLEKQPPRVIDRAHQYQAGVDTYAWDPSIDLYGGGGIAATMPDLVTFMRAVVRGDVFRKPETATLMRSLVVSPTQQDYRAGIGARPLDGLEAWGHSGYWNTFAYHIPELDLTVAGSLTENRSRATGSVVLGAVRILKELVKQ